MSDTDRGGRARFPRSVYGGGEDPDPRFSLANERTFLSWLRTSLALFAAAVALEALALPEHRGFRLAAVIVFVLTGFAALLEAWFGWAKNERALRHGDALPGLAAGLIVVCGVVVAMLLVVTGFVLHG